MLEKHLLVKTFPKADDKNVIVWKSFRVTVLFNRLFRIEKDETLKFSDLATQSIWYRNMPAVKFTTISSDEFLEIATDAVTLHLEDAIENSYVLIDGNKVPVNNDGNLLGTTRTLDCYNGDRNIKNFKPLRLGAGVCSKNGVAVIDDTKSLLLNDEGKLSFQPTDEMDIYVFTYGNLYREAVKALYAICGTVPLLPRYTFGNWWSRYHAYSADEYVDLMDQFADYGIPLTIATVDMDWHYSDFVYLEKGITEAGKADAFHGCGQSDNRRLGWTGYSWNVNLFPDYKDFLNQLKNRNLKITLNLHPADGVRYFEDMYEEMATAMGIDPKTEAVVPFDITNDDFINNYFKILHHPYEREGVDFWWIDWQQGSRSAMEGLDPLWALNHYHYYDNGRDGKHPVILSRYAGIGSHRYPIGFSGDTVISWETLAYLPYFTATASNVGYTWWGHDIGGHYHGIKDDELYLRFLQFGVFNPFNKLHCASSLMLTKEPWAYKSGTAELSREALCYRHRLIPFLHTANLRTAKEGLALVEPMYYEYPEIEDAYKARDQYFFGGSLIVAPITEHSGQGQLTKKAVWLPEGVFTDIFTGDKYDVPKGGAWITMVRPLDSIPALAKAGTVLPLGDDKGNSVDNPKALTAEIYNGNGGYTLYEDNELGVAAYTAFENIACDNTQTVKVSFSGDFSVLPEGRSIKFLFKNIVVNTQIDTKIGLEEKRYANITVLKNGKPIDAKVRKYGMVSVTVEDIDYNATYEVKVEYSVLAPVSEAKRKALLKLQLAAGSLKVRSATENDIAKATTVPEVKSAILISDIAELDKRRLLEDII